MPDMEVTVTTDPAKFEGATEANAWATAGRFAAALTAAGDRPAAIQFEGAAEDGYYSFTLVVGGLDISVDLPGFDPKWIDKAGATEDGMEPVVWVRGTSYWWEFALTRVAELAA